MTIPASLASVTQRAGRAGRTSPGICYRLYPEHVLRSLPRSTSPEITRSDLAVPILQLKYLGIDDLMKFDWVTSPPAENVLRAVENLVALGMISEDGRLTAVGEKVAECPLDVNIAQMVSFKINSCLFSHALIIYFIAVYLKGVQMRRGDSHYCGDGMCAGRFYHTGGRYGCTWGAGTKEVRGSGRGKSGNRTMTLFGILTRCLRQDHLTLLNGAIVS